MNEKKSIEKYAEELNDLLTEINSAGYIVSIPPLSIYERAKQATIEFTENWDASKYKIIVIS